MGVGGPGQGRIAIGTAGGSGAKVARRGILGRGGEVAPPVALTIAGSDSGGGAGIQADLKTFQAFGVFGASAITAVTAQNTRGVSGIQRIEPELVVRQIRAVAEDLEPAAAKTGMLADLAILEAVGAAVREEGLAPLVVDPVMISTSGDRLLAKEAERAYRELYPLAALITPNLREAELLTGRPVGDLRQMCEAARTLVDQGCGAALIKGGHLAGGVVLDVLHDGERWHLWRSERLGSADHHGTGCTLSAAVTAGLALGLRLFPAVDRALRFTRGALRTALRIGGGHRPLDHWTPVDSSGARGSAD